MATLPILCDERRELVRITVPLGRELPERAFYGVPEFADWMHNVVPTLAPGRLKAVQPPQEQLDDILYQWIAGRRIIYNRMFKDLMPMSDEVWEFKTPDLRIFGWVYRPKIFIAVLGDCADYYKGRNRSRTYGAAKQSVLDVRERLDVDAPKFTGGPFDELV